MHRPGELSSGRRPLPVLSSGKTQESGRRGKHSHQQVVVNAGVAGELEGDDGRWQEVAGLVVKMPCGTDASMGIR